MPSPAETQAAIAPVLDGLKDLLIEKNKRYGNSALKPLRIFSKADADEGIKVRLDDKLNRIIQGGGDIRKNDVADLMGYPLRCLRWRETGRISRTCWIEKGRKYA